MNVQNKLPIINEKYFFVFYYRDINIIDRNQKPNILRRLESQPYTILIAILMFSTLKIPLFLLVTFLHGIFHRI